jgi:phosphoribosylaminoimidazolecarboxamide formyltransferase/IMP cyclohydrolase
MKDMPIKRALISVSNKDGIIDFARYLVEKGVDILSTGGTARLLAEHVIPVMSVESYTEFPEMMDGRVKTLHPKIHGAILAIRDNEDHCSAMEHHGIIPIDMVVVNLYPFRQTIARPDVTVDEAIENIDIGGPTMVRSAAKNHAYISVVVDPEDYAVVIDELRERETLSFDTRKRLAVKAFAHTADYDAAIDTYLSERYNNEKVCRLNFRQGAELRYGENPHQAAVFYRNPSVVESSVAAARQLHGKELSYNNLVDGDAAFEAVKELKEYPAAAVIKHTNPCGYATGKTLAGALAAAWSGDPVSAFGSVIALTREVDGETAKVLSGRFVEVLIAPGYTDEALEFLKKKSSMLRLLTYGELNDRTKELTVVKHITGGLLTQDRDLLDYDTWETVTQTPFPESKMGVAKFAWKACKHVKSNAIICAQEYEPDCYRVVGMGAGQPNRVDSLRKLSVTKAKENLEGEYRAAGKDIRDEGKFSEEFSEFVMASDAFFPFADTIEEACRAGIRYIVQPGGSKRDEEVIAACNKHDIAMIFTGTRHFRH